jgi:hypothetical protein
MKLKLLESNRYYNEKGLMKRFNEKEIVDWSTTFHELVHPNMSSKNDTKRPRKPSKKSNKKNKTKTQKKKLRRDKFKEIENLIEQVKKNTPPPGVCDHMYRIFSLITRSTRFIKNQKNHKITNKQYKKQNSHNYQYQNVQKMVCYSLLVNLQNRT